MIIDLTDDYTYDNPCHLEIEACELQSKTPDETLKVKHEGQCLPGDASLTGKLVSCNLKKCILQMV